jgi:hypothetical protein
MPFQVAPWFTCVVTPAPFMKCTHKYVQEYF